MLFLIDISFQLIALVMATPVGWILVSVVVAASPLARVAKKARLGFAPTIDLSVTRFASEAALLAIAPLAILALGTAFHLDWQVKPAHPNEALLLNALAGFSFLQLAALGWFIWRHCARQVATIVVTVVAALWTAGAHFASTMAITGDWL